MMTVALKFVPELAKEALCCGLLLLSHLERKDKTKKRRRLRELREHVYVLKV